MPQSCLIIWDHVGWLDQGRKQCCEDEAIQAQKEKRGGEERNADMEFCPHGKDITPQDSSSVFVKSDQRHQIVLAEL